MGGYVELWRLCDSGSLRSIVCRSMLEWFEYVDTKEVRLIQGIVGSLVQITLVEIEVEVHGKCETPLCGLVEHLFLGATLLVGND